MSYRLIKTEEKEGVFILTLNDPATRNALGVDMAKEIVEALDGFEASASRVLLITGSGQAFCSGANLRGLEQMAPVSSPEGAERSWQALEHRQALELRQMGPIDHIRYVPYRIWQVQKPTVAAVNGHAYGVGFGLAWSCDIVLAAEQASFSEAFVRIGLVPADGSCWVLPRVIGLSNTFLLQYTAEAIDSAEAQRMGVVSRVYSQEQLMPEALALATRLAGGATYAMGLTKYLVRRSLETGFREAWETAGAAQDLAGRTEDHREGLRAFLEKRRPQFKGR
ncbi:MAG: enoyl-CoA hydratase/isomerase family protein [Chloroflexi bacterium]|nr:enoyl-CoA hydratase/isomerase family protein [Chloroflexota bacterium]